MSETGRTDGSIHYAHFTGRRRRRRGARGGPPTPAWPLILAERARKRERMWAKERRRRKRKRRSCEKEGWRRGAVMRRRRNGLATSRGFCPRSSTPTEWPLYNWSYGGIAHLLQEIRCSELKMQEMKIMKLRVILYKSIMFNANCRQKKKPIDLSKYENTKMHQFFSVLTIRLIYVVVVEINKTKIGFNFLLLLGVCRHYLGGTEWFMYNDNKWR